MELITELFQNYNLFLLVSGLLFILLSIIGDFKTKWFDISLTKYKSVLIGGLGFFLLSISLLMANVKVLNSSSQVSTPLEEIVLNGGEYFEWQWSGQNWMGKVYFYQDNGAVKCSLTVNKEFTIENTPGKVTRVNRPLIMNTIEPGEVKINDNWLIIEDLKVKKNIFRAWIDSSAVFKERLTPKNTSEVIIKSFKLNPISALAGIIVYKDLSTGYEWEGDMVLVDYNQAQY